MAKVGKQFTQAQINKGRAINEGIIAKGRALNHQKAPKVATHAPKKKYV